MKYLMLVCTTGWNEPGPDDAASMGEATDVWVEQTTGRGVRLLGHQLHPVDQARTIRVRDGRRTVTDGPFAEAAEQMAGFDLLECADLEEAIEVAAQHPMARFGTIEIRPMYEDAPPA